MAKDLLNDAEALIAQHMGEIEAAEVRRRLLQALLHPALPALPSLLFCPCPAQPLADKNARKPALLSSPPRTVPPALQQAGHAEQAYPSAPFDVFAAFQQQPPPGPY